MKRTNLYLDETQTVVLDQLARGQGISRAELVRRLLDRSINSAPVDLEADLAAIKESFGVLDDEDLIERGPGERETHLDQIRSL